MDATGTSTSWLHLSHSRDQIIIYDAMGNARSNIPARDSSTDHRNVVLIVACLCCLIWLAVSTACLWWKYREEMWQRQQLEHIEKLSASSQQNLLCSSTRIVMNQNMTHHYPNYMPVKPPCYV